MSDLQTIENIRNLISQGRTKIAAEHLIVLTHTRHKEFYESALMLKSRLETLEKETIEGVLSHSEQSVEQARILKSLLSLTSSIEEAERPLVEKIENLQNKLWERRNVWIGISMVILIGALSYWSFSKINNGTHSATSEPDVFDLVLVMDMVDKSSPMLTAQAFKVRFGNTPLSKPSIQNNRFVFHSLSKKHWDDSLNVEFLNKDYDIEFKKEERKSDKSSRTRIYIITEKKKVFEGYVQFPNGQPAPSAIVEIGFQNNVYIDTTDKNGHYKIQLPIYAVGNVINLKLKYNGKSIDYPNKTVDETYLKILKIHF